MSDRVAYDFPGFRVRNRLAHLCDKIVHVGSYQAVVKDTNLGNIGRNDGQAGG